MKISVYNTTCKISDFNTAEVNKLYEFLSVKHPRARFMKSVREGHWDGIYRYLNRYRMTFPTGFLPKVINFLLKQSIPYTIEDCRIIPTKLDNFPSANIELFPYQQRIFELIKERNRGVIWLPVNAGKTYLAMKLVEYKAVRTLWIVPLEEIFKQTKVLLEESFNTKVGLIGMGYKVIKSPITLAMIQTLSRNHSAEYINMLSNNFDLVLFDEVHHSGRNTYSKTISALDIYYKFGMSGTPKHRDIIDIMSLEATFGDILVKMDSKKLQEFGVSALPDVRMITIKNDPATKETYQDAYEDLIINNDKRNDIIAMLAKQNAAIDRRVLIMVDRILHGEIILEKLKQIGVTKAAFIYGEDSPADRKKALDDFALGNIEILISSTILNEGVNIPAIDCVIVAGAGKSPVKTVQRVGRALRKRIGKDKAYIIDFYDEGNRYMKAHSEKRFKTYEREIGDVTIHDVKI